ncbi:MAG TPA: biopolymer transporter ExbD [Candidatus Limnocylindria bacterium]|nr:biopolymer transporter ExbD [Candidatus Limnocylindria bacterium]
MAKPPKAFDVWFVVANTVYKGVPYNVVADWVQQGRLAPTDMVRPAATNRVWATIAEHEFLSDYLPRPSAAKAVPAAPPLPPEPSASQSAEPPAAELPDPESLALRRPGGDDDDEVDMIPLIDISMVLLVFFIMLQAASALPSIDVPEMKYAGQLSTDPTAITITIEKLNEEQVFYSVRIGPVAPKPSHDLLSTPGDAINALNELLAGVQRPPEVRVACRKDLPYQRVVELQEDLEALQKKGYINNFVATVVEAPER